jgi:hypothetical protein
MRVHAMFCFGALADARDRCAHPERWRDGAPRSRPGNAWTERAIGAQIELERDLWLPGRCCFRAAAPAPAIADAPPVADAATLLPASAGLLVATGDRLPQHLTHTLDALERAHTTGAEAAALCLATATQLVDDDARERSWTRLLAALDGDRDGTSAGLVLDALLYAVTGVRNATGAGVDEGWLRCAPWLPPGHEHLAVRGVCADGCRLDLELTARSGPARADEADRSAHFGGDGPRLHVRVVLVQSRDEKARPVIVAGATVQTVQWLQPGESFACSLPRVQTQPQHDARAIDGRSPECGEEVRRR